MVSTDRHNHRLVAGDSDGVEAIEILARAHQLMVWSGGRQTSLGAPRCASSTTPPWPPSRIWPEVTPSRCFGSLPPLRLEPGFPAQRSPPLFAAVAAKGESTSGPPRSKPRRAPTSSNGTRPCFQEEMRRLPGDEILSAFRARGGIHSSAQSSGAATLESMSTLPWTSWGDRATASQPAS
jgi:hypothetical protein